jgi:hypothetical protein
MKDDLDGSLTSIDDNDALLVPGPCITTSRNVEVLAFHGIASLSAVEGNTKVYRDSIAEYFLPNIMFWRILKTDFEKNRKREELSAFTLKTKELTSSCSERTLR